MTIKFIITIDTEEDQWDNYSTEYYSVENINRLLFLQEIFDKYNAVPTYLINWPVISDPKSSQIIKKLCNEHNCEIGTHCHPWNTPPFGEEINEKNTIMCNLPYEVIEQKMGRLHEAIVKTLNVEPLCFRAGRWGFGSNVAKCIQQLGYTIDTSVTPFVDWSVNSGPNFNGASTFPYHFEARDILKQCSDGPLFEVPASIGFIQRNFEISDRIRKIILSTRIRKLRLLGILDKLKLLNHRWLAPELSSAEDMIKLINVLVLKGHRVLNFTLHSTSLLPGKSPYIKSEEDFYNFIKKIETVLAYCNHKNFGFAPLSNIQH
ncbi:MAG: hypothetical protein HF978_04645 [Desulfobacteraceae bacterium]|nr:hypothetical protein [Desulfobacteraceae bacterium]MBC2754818.1 hypothetical protein [Desulfobacteraceae bacterium]